MLAEFDTLSHWFALCSGCANTATLQQDDVQVFMLRVALDALNWRKKAPRNLSAPGAFSRPRGKRSDHELGEWVTRKRS